MANEKLSQLPSVSTSSNGDLYYLVQGGISSSITFTNLKNAIATASSVTSLNGLTGALNIVAGSNITVTPSGSSITISTAATPLTFADSLVNTSGTVTLKNDSASPAASQYYGTNGSGVLGYYSLGSAGLGTVTDFIFTNGGGFTGSVSSPTTIPTLSLTAVLSGDVTGPLTATVLSATTNSTLITLSALSLPGSQVTGNISGNAANVTATTNNTLTTLSALTTATNLAISGSKVSGGTFGAINGSALTNLSASALSGVLPVGVTGGSGLSINYSQLTGIVPTWNQNTTGTASNITATSNSTLTTLPNLSLPYSQITGTPSALTFSDSLVLSAGNVTLKNDSASLTANQYYGTNGSSVLGYYNLPAPGTGTVTSFIFTNGGGFTGSVATATTTPTLSLTGTLTGDVTGTLTATVLSATTNATLTTLSALALPYSQLTGTVPTWNQNTTGTAANVTATTNNTLTTLSALSLPYSQLTGTPSLSGYATTTLNNLGLTGYLYSNGSGSATASTTIPYSALSGTVPTWNQNTTGTAANITATTNSTLTTLSALSLPYSQVTGVPPISGFTQGSVLFANSLGQISQDNSKFYWDDTNFTLGIGVIPAAATMIDGVNISGATKPVQMTGYGGNVGFRTRRASGTAGSPTASILGDTLGFFGARGYGATGFAATSTGAMNILAGGTFTDTSMPTYIAFNTTPTGSVTGAERMRINSTGNVLIGTTTDNGLDALQLGPSDGISANYVKFAGSTSGYVEFIAPTAPTPYNMVLPSAQGAASSYLQNDGSGNLSWTTSGSPPVVTSNIDGGSSATLYTTPQLVNGGTP